MTPVRDNGITRRTVLKGAAGAAAAGALSGTFAETALASRAPLWKVAQRNGIAYGAAIATWMFEDDEYMALVKRQVVPAVTSSRPATIRNSVVFPQPDGPTSTIRSPSSIARSTARTAWVPSG